MKHRATTLATLITFVLCGAVFAADLTWSGGGGGPEWRDCRLIPDTDPQEFMNNWGYHGYAGCPGPIPGIMDTGHINMAGGPPRIGLPTSTGTVSVEAGGLLEIYEQLSLNFGLLSGGVVRLGNSAFITNTTLETTGTGSISSNHPWTSVLPNPTLDDATVVGSISVWGNTMLELRDTITNNGVFDVDASELVIGSDTRLEGGGEVVMSGVSFFAGQTSNGAYRLTNVDNTIHGEGRLGGGSPSGEGPQMAITNQHLIIADQGSPLLIAPSPAPDDAQASVVNSGILRATGGATMELHHGSYNNTGGTIAARDGSVVELYNDVTITGGTLQTSGSGAIRSADPSNSTLADPILKDLTTNGLLEVPDGMLFHLLGSITNTGTITVGASGGVLRIGNDVTLDGSGTVELANHPNSTIQNHYGSANRLTNVDNTIRGSGQIGYTDLALTNSGLIEANQPTALLLLPVSNPADGLAPVINNGTLRASSGATLRLYGDATYDNSNGIIEALDGSAVELDAGAWVSGGVLQTSGSGVFRSNTESWRRAWIGDVTINGAFEMAVNKELGIGGTITNNGAWTCDRSFIHTTSDVVLAGNGVLTLINVASIRDDAGSTLTNAANHTISSTGTSNNLIYPDFTNDGRLVVDSGKLLWLRGAYDPRSGSITDVNGTLGFHIAGTTMAGTLTGSGAVSGSLTVVAPGVLAPGSSAGTLTTGSLTISDGALYEWEIDGVAADLVDVAGTLDFGAATLTVAPTVISGPAPTEIVLFEYDALVGVPDTSQIVLTGGWSYTGIDTGSNRITLTGVVFSELIFADGFETNDTSEWSVTMPSGKSGSVDFRQPNDWFEIELRLAHRTKKHLSPTPAELVRVVGEDGRPLLQVEARRGETGLIELRLVASGSVPKQWASVLDPSRSIILQRSGDEAYLDGVDSLLTISSAGAPPAAGFHLRGVIRTGGSTTASTSHTR